MPHVEVQRDGAMKLVSSSKHKPKSGHNHHSDSRDQKMANLQRQLDEVEEQKEQLLIQYQNLKELKKQAVEEAKSFKQAATKYKQALEETRDDYEDLHTRFER